ncbi:MAG: hypothetical protein HKN79_05900 [Flavobacteriales bacterium]|nr:hypothetical protein [Flavobacteriales bacterium]
MRRLKRIVGVLLLLSVIMFGALIGLSYVFEDEISAKLRSSINSMVDTEIQVQDLELSLISDFPNAAVRFTEVVIMDPIRPDTHLLKAETISLQFDLWELATGSYSIDAIGVENGELHMFTTETGEVNYIFWTASESEDEVQFQIENIDLKDLKYSFIDRQSELSITSDIEDAALSLHTGSESYSISGEIDGRHTSLLIQESSYLASNDIRLEADLTVSSDGSQIHFESSSIGLGENEVELHGQMHREEQWHLDLRSQSRVQVEDLLSQLPEDITGSLKGYEPHGPLDYDLVITGSSDGRWTPALQMEFEWTGTARLAELGKPLENIRSKGIFLQDSAQFQSITFKEMYAELETGTLSYTGRLSNIKRPRIKGELVGEAALSDILAHTGQQLIDGVSGVVGLQLDLDGYLPMQGLTVEGIQALDIFGKADLTNVGFDLVANGYECRGITSSVILQNDAVMLDETALMVNGDELLANAKVEGLWEYLFRPEGKLRISADVSAETVDWNQWAKAAAPHQGGGTSLPEHIQLTLDAQVQQFAFQSFHAEGITGRVSMKDRKVLIDPISFRSCGGDVVTDVHLQQSDDLTWKVDSECSLRGVDVPELFRQFGQFGQEFLTDDQLNGTGDAIISFSARLDSQMTVLTPSIASRMDITITNGELIQHPSMMDIVTQLRERNLLKPFVRADELENELKHLRFERLHNVVHIQDQQILIPHMTIANNAMDVEVSGSHGFDNRIDYSVGFTLRDILVNKRNPEFIVQDDGLGHRIHLSMTGTTTDPDIALDKDKVKANRKEAIASAKSDIKEFLSNPFKRDKEPERDEREGVTVQIEETPKTEEASAPKEKKKKWWQITEPEETEAPPVEIEEDDF